MSVLNNGKTKTKFASSLIKKELEVKVKDKKKENKKKETKAKKEGK